MNRNMKKLLYSALVLACLGIFASCEDDRDDNPTLVEATEFILNEPAYASQLVDLATSSQINLVCSQPNWQFPLAVSYVPQVSLDGNFTVSNLQQDADETGAVKANYYQFDPTTSNNISINSEEVAKAITYLNSWNSEDVIPSSMAIYVRAIATPSTQTAPTAPVESLAIASNAVKMTVSPYYVELADAPVVMWYLVGNLFGGKWGSIPGETALPMFIDPEAAYDKKDGTGVLTYTNYFITGDYEGNECGTAGFKIQPSNFNWDFGMTGDNSTKGSIIYRDGGSDGGHIVAEADGYYTLTLDTKTLTGKLEKYEGDVKTFASVSISGSFNDWSDTEMLPYNGSGENHAWYTVQEFSEKVELKFKETGSWDTNWGFGSENGEVNLRGVGVGNGNNIGIEAGKWLIILDDITGVFNIMAL